MCTSHLPNTVFCVLGRDIRFFIRAAFFYVSRKTLAYVHWSSLGQMHTKNITLEDLETVEVSFKKGLLNQLLLVYNSSTGFHRIEKKIYSTTVYCGFNYVQIFAGCP